MVRRFETDALETVRDLIRWGASRFREAELVFGHGTDNALDEAYFLTLWALHLPTDLPAVYLEAKVTDSERASVLKLLRARLKTRKPAAYLIGEIEFAGMPFFVDERVLVPRSPIGELIRHDFSPWLQREPQRILDLCTGSGCIGIACATQFPEAQVDLADISPGALAVARKNIKRHGLEDQVQALRSDVYDGLGETVYDLIVTNPPYVTTGEWKQLAAEYRHEPRLGLEAGEDGMEIVERILIGAIPRLSEDGILVCEVGDSVPEFEARWPQLPVTWVEFTHGGSGVFVISRADLAAHLQEA